MVKSIINIDNFISFFNTLEQNRFGLISFIITTVISLSGWVVFLYERWTAGPRIKGKVLTVITGKLDKPKPLTSFLVYLYITNLRNNSVHILEYGMEVEYDKGFQRLERVYGIDNVPNWTFTDNNGKEIVISDFKNKLIYKNRNPVQYGELYCGFILFAGKNELYNNKAKRFRITCTDALGNKHKFTSTPKEFCNLYLLQELAGIVFPKII